MNAVAELAPVMETQWLVPRPRAHFVDGWLRLLIVDRYLLRQFMQTFLICFCSLTGLYIVIDAFNNLDEFITYSQKHGSLLEIMGRYYAYRSLSFFDSMSHVLTLIAAMFTVTWIQRHNELTALQAAGIPKSRIVRPIVAAVALISLASAANREFVIPAVREHLSYNAQDLGGRSGKPLQSQYDNLTGILIGGGNSKMFGDEKRIHLPDFLMPAGLNRYDVRIMAEDAYYKPASEGRPSGYLFCHVTRPTGLDRLPSLSRDGQPVLLTPLDYPWLKPDECFIVSQMAFEHLEGGSSFRQLSSTWELIQGLRNRSLNFGAEERVAIHARLVQPLLDITLLFLGLPLILSRTNRNVFVAIGLCLLLVIAFMMVVMGCKQLGTAYWIEPSLAAWLPLMIFVPLAVALAQPLHE